MGTRRKVVVSITMEPEQLRELEGYTFDRSRAIRKIINRYRALVSAGFSEVTKSLTPADIATVCEAIIHAGRDSVMPESLPAAVAGMLARKPRLVAPGSSALDIEQTLETLSTEARLALIDESDRRRLAE